MFRKYVYILSGLLGLSSPGTKFKLWLGIGQAFSKREGRGVKTTKKMSKCGSVLSSDFLSYVCAGCLLKTCVGP